MTPVSATVLLLTYYSHFTALNYRHASSFQIPFNYNVHVVSIYNCITDLMCIGATDAGGSTPLDYAIQKGHTETIEYLQSLGAPSAAPIQSTVYQSPPVEQQPQGI